MTEKLLRHIETKLPAFQGLLCTGPELPVHVHDLGVHARQVGQVLVHQLPHQVVVEAGPVRGGHDDGDVGCVLGGRHHHVGVLGDLGAGEAGLQHLQPRDVDGDRPQLSQLKHKYNLYNIKKYFSMTFKIGGFPI